MLTHLLRGLVTAIIVLLLIVIVAVAQYVFGDAAAITAICVELTGVAVGLLSWMMHGSKAA